MHESGRGDTKDHTLSPWFINFSEADELLKLAAAREQVKILVVFLFYSFSNTWLIPIQPCIDDSARTVFCTWWILCSCICFVPQSHFLEKIVVEDGVCYLIGEEYDVSVRLSHQWNTVGVFCGRCWEHNLMLILQFFSPWFPYCKSCKGNMYLKF